MLSNNYGSTFEVYYLHSNYPYLYSTYSVDISKHTSILYLTKFIPISPNYFPALQKNAEKKIKTFMFSCFKVKMQGYMLKENATLFFSQVHRNGVNSFSLTLIGMGHAMTPPSDFVKPLLFLLEQIGFRLTLPWF